MDDRLTAIYTWDAVAPCREGLAACLQGHHLASSSGGGAQMGLMKELEADRQPVPNAISFDLDEMRVELALGLSADQARRFLPNIFTIRSARSCLRLFVSSMNII